MPVPWKLVSSRLLKYNWFVNYCIFRKFYLPKSEHISRYVKLSGTQITLITEDRKLHIHIGFEDPSVLILTQSALVEFLELL